MNRESFSALWHSRREKMRSDYETILSTDPYENWDKNKMPEGVAEEYLTYALEILLSGDSGPQAQAFLKLTREVCERILSENQLAKGLRAVAFPKNRARVFRALSYAEFLSRAPLDRDRTLDASRDFETWCKSYSRADWSGSQAQAAYLAAVRLSLVAGNARRAGDLLADARPMNWHQAERDTLSRLASEAVRGPLLRDENLLGKFDAYFDLIRNPSFRSEAYVEIEFVRLELGAIRYAYFFSPDGQPDPLRTVDAIAG